MKLTRQAKAEIAEARARYKRARVELTRAARALSRIAPGEGAPPSLPAIQLVQKIVAAHYNLDLALLYGAFRGEPVVTARHLAMVLVRRLTTVHLVEIGVAFNRERTSVIHALGVINARCATEPELFATYNALFAACKAALAKEAA